jgi:hypothetical protein
LYGKKKKKSKLDVLIIIALLSLSAGLGVAACGNAPAGSTIEATIVPISPNEVEVTVTVNGVTQPPVIVTTPAPPNTIVVAICEEAPTASPTPTPVPELNRDELKRPGAPNAEKGYYI